MQIKVFGLRLIPSPSVELDRLWTATEKFSKKQLQALEGYLESDAEALPPIIADGRLVLLQPYENEYRAGVMLKLRDAKSVFEVQKSGRGTKIAARSLLPGQRQIEVNFFVLRADTGVGLYAHYHQSTHMNDFCRLMKRIHEGLLQKEREALDLKQKEGELTKKQVKEGRSKLKSLTYALLTRNGDAGKLINDLTKIKKVTVSFEDWQKQTAGELKPLQQEAKLTAVNLSFSPDSNLASIKQTLVGLLSKPKMLKRLRVEGMDPDDLDQVIYLEKNLDDFARTEYDQLAQSMKEVDLSNLAKSWKDSAALKWLKNVAETSEVKRRLTAQAKP